MKREALLGGGALAVVAAMVVLAALNPAAFARPEPDRPPGHVSIRDVTITPASVSGGTATLGVETRLDHDGGPIENVTVLLRATSLETGFVESTRTLSAGTLRGGDEVPVNGTITVERAGGYRVETVVFRNGTRVDAGATEVRGVGALQPPYARSPVQFQQFDGGGLPSIEFSVAEAGTNRTTLDVSTYLTNTGDDPADDLQVVLKARQADSNIVADEATVDVGAIRPGRTDAASGRLDVPTGYNYYLDAVLWRDGVVLGSARGAANLEPTETLSVDETRRTVGLEVSEFERTDAERGPPGRTTVVTESGGTPGFGPVVAAVALLLSALLVGRRRGR